MDGLVQHVVAELSMQGEAGASADSLLELATEYSNEKGLEQLIDRPFIVFLWSQLAELPEVGVGVAPASKKDDFRLLKKPHANSPDLNTSYADLNALDETHDGRARLCVTPEVCWYSLTLSHNRPSKLTPNVYAVLQYVAGARGEGKTTIDITKKFGFDPKSVFHYVKSLLELDLIVKLRATQANCATNRIIHKRYLNASEHWKAFNSAKAVIAKGAETAADDEEDGDDGQDAPETDGNPFQFTPVDPYLVHINTELIRQRIVQVCKASANYCVARKNLAKLVNIQPLDKIRRKKCTAIVADMIKDGIIEFGAVANQGTGSSATLVRLRADYIEAQSAMAEDPAVDSLVEMAVTNALPSTETDDVPGRFSFTGALGRQVIDVVAKLDERGASSKAASKHLAGISQRFVESVLVDVEAQTMPASTSDLSVIGVFESIGREKHVRYFSLPGYAARCNADGVDLPPTVLKKLDLTAAGGWSDTRTVEYRPTIKEFDKACANLPHTVSQNRSGKRNAKTVRLVGDAPKKLGRPKKIPGAPKAPYNRTKPTKSGLAGKDVPKKAKKGKIMDSESDQDELAKSGDEDGAVKVPAKRARKAPDANGPRKKTKTAKKVISASPDLEVDDDVMLLEDAAAEAGPSSKASQTTKSHAIAVNGLTIRQPISLPISSTPLPASATLSLPAVKRGRGRPPKANGNATVPAASDSSTANIDPALRNAVIPRITFPTPIDVDSEPVGKPAATAKKSAIAQPKPISVSKAPLPKAASLPVSEPVLPPPVDEAEGTTSKRGFKRKRFSLAKPTKPKDKIVPVEEIHDTEDAPPAQLLLEDDSMRPENNAMDVDIDDSAIVEIVETKTGQLSVKNAAKRKSNSERKSHTAHKLEADVVTVLENSDGVMEDGVPVRNACDALARQRSAVIAGETLPSVDTKTMRAALDRLENNNVIRRLTVSLPTLRDTHRQYKLICLASLSPNSPALKALLGKLRSRVSVLPFQVPAVPDVATPAGAVVPRVRSRARDGADAPEKARENWRCVAQYYGYLVGVWRRVACLHSILEDLAMRPPADAFGTLRGIRSDGTEAMLFGIDALMRELTLDIWIKLIPVTTYDQKLTEFIGGNKSQKVHDLMDNEWSDALNLSGRTLTKAKPRIFNLLLLLAAFDLLRAVSESSEADSDFTVDQGSIARHFALKSESQMQPDVSTLWLLQERLPFYQFCEGNEEHPIVKYYDLEDGNAVDLYWSQMHAMAAENGGIPEDSQTSTDGKPWTGSPMLIQSLHNKASWKRDYMLQPAQQDWIRAKVTTHPVAPAEMLEEWSKEILVPVHQLVRLHDGSRSLRARREKRPFHVRDSDSDGPNAQNAIRSKKAQASLQAMYEEELRLNRGRKVIEDKARAAQARKEHEWQMVLANFTTTNGQGPPEGPGLDRLRSTFCGPGGLSEESLTRALRLLCTVHAAHPRREIRQAAAPAVSKPVADPRQDAPLVLAEAEAIPAPEVVDGNKGRRRWTSQENDLLRDFWVVMQARSQTLNNAPIPWKFCYDNIVRTHGANQLRTHFNTVLYQGENKAYCNTLVLAWKAIYSEARGRPELPETDKNSMTGIDVLAHIRYLRTTVFTAVANMNLSGDGSFGDSAAPVIDLLANPSQMFDRFSIKERAAADSPWIEMATLPSTQLKEQYAAATSGTFVVPSENVTQVSPTLGLAMATIRSLLATPDEAFDVDSSHAILAAMGDKTLERAIEGLRKEGVLVKILSEAGRRLPGRNFAFADKFNQVFNKHMDEESLYVASETGAKFLATDTVLPLVLENGQMLSFLSAVSEDKITLEIDTSPNAFQRDPEDYASRKLDDESIESSVLISQNTASPTLLHHPAMQPLVLKLGQMTLLSALDDNTRTLATALNSAGVHGLDVEDLLRTLQSQDPLSRAIEKSVLANRIAVMTMRGNAQTAFWAGYDQPILVGIQHASAWGSKNTKSSAFLPRLWLDIQGQRIEAMEKRLRLLFLGCLHENPGCSISQLVNHLRPVLTTVEVVDFLEAMHADKTVRLTDGDTSSSDFCRLDWPQYRCYSNERVDWWRV